MEKKNQVLEAELDHYMQKEKPLLCKKDCLGQTEPSLYGRCVLYVGGRISNYQGLTSSSP